MSAKAKSSTGRRRMKFLPEEDEKLRELVAKYGKSWNDIAKHLPGRNVRQCRERWKHYLSSDRAKSPWSNEEDLLLFQKFMELGPKWTKIAKFFDDRTDIQIKTRWMKRFGGCAPVMIPPKIQQINPPMMDVSKNVSPVQTDVRIPPVVNSTVVLQSIPINQPTVSNVPIAPAVTPVPSNSGGTSHLTTLPKFTPGDNFYHKMLYTFDDDISPHQDIDIFTTENSDNLNNVFYDF
ncbi:hypothetical protein M9Y10_039553 [Tritrichomonas musculus]|uniref:Myb-like DNA-binding domain containing protein n=1 Tax=Tritrichomonas musculus TaxID=1915356 RepID=A0ABR2GIT8_9EUKA